MANYGEQLAYWYLRLNGFFPMANFVVHRDGGLNAPSDVDVLAIRTSHVYEEVGGQDGDWHDVLCGEFDRTRTLGLICEVKTGRIMKNSLFRPKIVKRAVLRLGLISPVDVQSVMEELAEERRARRDSATILKLLISEQPHDRPAHLNITLSEIEEFLKHRIRQYRREKFASRLFFPSELFQHLIAQVDREQKELGCESFQER